MTREASIDAWLESYGVEVVGATGSPDDPAFSRDIVVDGDRRFDLRITIAWVTGLGWSVWAYYGLEAMEIPKRTYARMLRANFEYPFVKFAMTEDDRPMLMTELPAAGVDRDELGRAIARLAVVADRLLEETANAVADRGLVPDWSDRAPRNRTLLDAHRDDLVASMPPWVPPRPKARRRGIVSRLMGRS